jgi:DNA repair exonuclease SbcCD ATPase subunit
MIRVLAIILLLNLCSSVQAGGFYKWKDENGVLHITDHPPGDSSNVEVDTNEIINKAPMGGQLGISEVENKITPRVEKSNPINERIANLESELRYLNSQKRMDKSMERDGLRREIAEKEELLNDLYMVKSGVPQDQVSLMKQKKDLKNQKERLEGEKASMQAEMMSLENEKRDAEREVRELEHEKRQIETEKRQMEANRAFNWP